MVRRRPRLLHGRLSRGPFWLDYRHPLLPVLVHVPIALAASVARLFGVPDAGAALTLALPAVLAAVRALVVLGLGRRLTGRLVPAALLTVTDLFAATMITVTSVPVGYALSAVCLAMMFRLAVGAATFSWMGWIAVATVAIGTTTTNAMTTGLVATAALVRRGRGFAQAVSGSAVVVAAAVVVTVVTAAIGAWVYGYSLAAPQMIVAREYRHPPSREEGARLAWTIATTFLAPPPATEAVEKPRGVEPRFHFRFTYRPPFVRGWESWWRALATVGMLALGTWGLCRRRDLRPVVWSVVAVLAANVAVHAFYGIYYHIHAPHWAAALLVLLSGVAILPGRLRPIGTTALAAFTLLTVVSSLTLVANLLARLHAVP